MSRKQFRHIDGATVALAAACVDCGSANIYGRDRCHACYMKDYRRGRKALSEPVIMAESPVPPKAPKASKPETIRKPRALPKPETAFEPVSTARIVSRYLRAL